MEEVIEDNPPFQHPLILRRLFSFRCLAVLDVSVSARTEEEEEKKTNTTTLQFPQSAARAVDASRLETSSWRTSGLVPAAAPPSLVALAPDVQCEKFVLIFLLFLTFHRPLSIPDARGGGRWLVGAALPLAQRHARALAALCHSSPRVLYSALRAEQSAAGHQAV